MRRRKKRKRRMKRKPSDVTHARCWVAREARHATKKTRWMIVREKEREE